MISRIFAGIAGCLALAAAANAVIDKTGGSFTDADALVTMAVGILVAVGAMTIPQMWIRKQYGLATLAVIAMFGAEGSNLFLLADRLMVSRDATQAPLRAAQRERDGATQRVQTIRAKLASFPAGSARMIAANKARHDADAAVVASAAKRGCARNCRMLLAQQMSAAAAEMQSARGAHAAQRQQLKTELREARAALEVLPAMRSATPLADRLQVSSLTVDLLFVSLKSLGLNGLAAVLLAFAAGHTPRRNAKVSPAIDVSADVIEAKFEHRGESALQLAKRFSLERLTPANGARPPIRVVVAAFQDWCREKGIEPHSARETISAFRDLFDLLEIQTVEEGGTIVAVDIDLLSPRLIEAA